MYISSWLYIKYTSTICSGNYVITDICNQMPGNIRGLLDFENKLRWYDILPPDRNFDRGWFGGVGCLGGQRDPAWVPCYGHVQYSLLLPLDGCYGQLSFPYLPPWHFNW